MRFLNVHYGSFSDVPGKAANCGEREFGPPSFYERTGFKTSCGLVHQVGITARACYFPIGCFRSFRWHIQSAVGVEQRDFGMQYLPVQACTRPEASPPDRKAPRESPARWYRCRKIDDSRHKADSTEERQPRSRRRAEGEGGPKPPTLTAKGVHAAEPGYTINSFMKLGPAGQQGTATQAGPRTRDLPKRRVD
jgi:hypothetical protein